MLCTARDQLRILGHFDSSSSRNLKVVFERCDLNNTEQIVCKSDEEVKEWMDNIYFLLWINEKHYDLASPSGQGLQERASIKWLHLHDTYPNSYVFQI